MLCGISTSFPVLSPIRRQVAHALLTRPPLFHSRRNFTVRLECVMHAASVHPEPGSNSLKNCISFSFAKWYLIFQSKLICSITCLELLYFLQLQKFKRIFGVFVLWSSKYMNLVVQFSMSCAFRCLPRGSQLIYYTTSSFLCQEVFSTFFKFFCFPLASRLTSCAALLQLR